MAGGVAAAGVIIALLAKKKRVSPVDDWQYNGPVEPDYDTNVLGIQWVEIPAGDTC
ncbi:MAG: hypothetical protein JSV88_25890 [Candidatus Aminicenantes bacterium]|nr:MAG: hypothetical protein JSV88_25890 [Candidatus Aminicenantes bacterium]